MSLVYSFKNEIELVVDDLLRDFLVDALNEVDISTLEKTNFANRSYVEYVKELLDVTMTMCDSVEVTDMVRDIFIVAVLLSKSFVVGSEDIDRFYAFQPRQKFYSLQNTIGREQYDTVMKLIESQDGLNSPIPQVYPSAGETALMWILPFANALTRNHHIESLGL